LFHFFKYKNNGFLLFVHKISVFNTKLARDFEFKGNKWSRLEERGGEMSEWYKEWYNVLPIAHQLHRQVLYDSVGEQSSIDNQNGIINDQNGTIDDQMV
jgi:hypothetical protein